jgi:hypothetical protein
MPGADDDLADLDDFPVEIHEPGAAMRPSNSPLGNAEPTWLPAAGELGRFDSSDVPIRRGESGQTRSLNDRAGRDDSSDRPPAVPLVMGQELNPRQRAPAGLARVFAALWRHIARSNPMMQEDLRCEVKG